MTAVDDETGPSGKGRATPSRREAEAARKKAMKTPLTRRERMRRERQARQQQRTAEMAALRAGDTRNLPARDRGPVRALVRDVVDRRYNVAEFLLPLLLLILVLSFIRLPWAALTVLVLWTATIMGVTIDSLVMVRGLRRQLAARFEKPQTRGAVSYGIMRSTQLRRFRLPKPTIGRGEPLDSRY